MNYNDPNFDFEKKNLPIQEAPRNSKLLFLTFGKQELQWNILIFNR